MLNLEYCNFIFYLKGMTTRQRERETLQVSYSTQALVCGLHITAEININEK